MVHAALAATAHATLTTTERDNRSPNDQTPSMARAPRDLTPEGTRSVLDREAPGLAEAMRLVSPLGRLSRGVAGTIGTAIVLNTPGSPKGCVEQLGAVIDIVPHAIRLLADQPTTH